MSKSKNDALRLLLEALAARGYHFVTPTPSTARRVRSQRALASDLRDVFGWSLPFDPGRFDPELLSLLEGADGIEPCGEGVRSRIRISTVAGELFLHSALPATEKQAVFLGPDSYRFAAFISAELAGRDQAGAAIFDVGCGAGVGGVVAAKHFARPRLWLGDINRDALRLAAVNAARAGLKAETAEGPGLSAAPEALDLIVANPPYVAGDSGKIYKDGGDLHGARLSYDWALEAMDRLSPGGQMLLYTGSSILRGGIDAFREMLEPAVANRNCTLRYRELDPDIFPSELRRTAYHDVERIAAVGAVITRPL